MYPINTLSGKRATNPKFSEMVQNNLVNYPVDDKLNWEWYNPSVDSVPVSFCMDTSLHGLKYMGQQKRHLFERIFWLVAFVASVIAAVILIYGMWADYSNMPTITVFNPTVTNLDEIPFPGLTICNVNSLRKSSFDNQIEKVMLSGILDDGGPLPKGANLSQEAFADLAKILDMNHICESTLTFTDRFVGNASILGWQTPAAREVFIKYKQEIEQYCDPIATLQNVSQPCSKMILHCVWLEDVTNCDELFQEIETDYGHCCTFNSLPVSLLLKQHRRSKPKGINKWKDANLNYENLMFTKKTINRTVPYRQRYPGRSAGLSILLDPDINEYFCTNTDSEGFMMGVNVPLDFPRMKDNGIALQTNSEIFISLKPEVTMSHDSIKKLHETKRQCYYGNEHKLRYYTTYTVSNCIDECIAIKTVEKCNCTRYYMPNDDTGVVCKPTMYNCTDFVRKTIVHYGLSRSCSECLPTCTQISYQKEITSLRLQERKMKELFKYFPETAGMKPYNARKVSIVHIYFSKNSMHPKLRKESTTMTELMSNAGGLLGLCMGFSVLSLLEILYYGSLRLCCSFYRNRTARNRREKRDERKNTRTSNVQSQTSELSRYPKPAWFSQALDQASSETNRIENNKSIFITKRKDKHDYGYYENDCNEFLGGNNLVIRRSMDNQSVFLPGSFEDQLHRAFLVTAFPEKVTKN